MQTLIETLKVQIIEQLNLVDIHPDAISPEEPLFGDGLGLDSIDALEMVVLLEKNYGIKVSKPEEMKAAFYSVAKMAEFITVRKAELATV